MDSLQGGEIHSIKIQGFSFQGQLARLRIPRAVFSPDGKVLALSQERKIRLLELETRKNLRTFSVPGGTIQSLAFSRDGTKLACASFDYFRGESAGVWVWDLPSGRIVHKLEHRDNFAFSLEFLPEGNGLLIGGVAPSLPGSRNPSERSGEIFFWDWDKDRLWPFATGKPGPVLSLTFSLNGQLLAFRNRRDSFSVCARDRGSYRLLPMDQSSSPTSSRQIEKMILSAERIQRVSFSKDGKQLAGVSSEGDIHLWETRTGALLWNYPDPKKTGNCFAISPDGTGWARCQDSQIVLRQFHAPDQFRHLESPQEELKALAFSADGKALLAGSAQGGIYSWDLGDAGHFRLIAREAGSIEVLTFSPDGLHFAIANRKGTIEWREYPSGQLKGTWKPGVITVNSLAFSPDASLLAAGTSETSLLIFDLPSGQLRQTLRQHTAAINGLAFSPDGKFLASGGDDRMVILWDLSSGRPKQIFKNHVQTVTSLVFAPDGLLLACGHGNNSVVLWNTQNKKLERILTLPELIQVRK
jgi:WD40 repeat protein